MSAPHSEQHQGGGQRTGLPEQVKSGSLLTMVTLPGVEL